MTRTVWVKTRTFAEIRAAHPDGPAWARHGVKDWRASDQHFGAPIRVQLPPVAPDDHWKCGTERVWRVPDEEVERFTGKAPFMPIFLCEHQVDCD